MPASENKIWIGQGGEKYGPYTEESLLRWMSEGKLSQDAIAWRKGMPEWISLSSFPFSNPANAETAQSSSKLTQPSHKASSARRSAENKSYDEANNAYKSDAADTKLKKRNIALVTVCVIAVLLLAFKINKSEVQPVIASTAPSAQDASNRNTDAMADENAYQAGLDIDIAGIATASGSMERLSTATVAFKLGDTVHVGKDSSAGNLKFLPRSVSTIVVLKQGTAALCIIQADSTYLCAGGMPVAYNAKADSVWFIVKGGGEEDEASFSHSGIVLADSLSGKIQIPRNAVSFYYKVAKFDNVAVSRATYINQNSLRSLKLYKMDGTSL